MEKYLIVVNPAAGRHTYLPKLNMLRDVLERRQLDYEIVFTHLEDVDNKLGALLCQSDTFRRIFILGGDGTLNYVINALPHFNYELAIVSNGTGNDTVKSIHGCLDFKRQLEIGLDGQVAKFDLGICNGRRFINGVGFSFDGMVVKKMQRRRKKINGHLAYYSTVLALLFSYKEPFFEIQLDDQLLAENIFSVSVAKGTTFGGGFVMNPNARGNDGLLDIALIRKISILRRLLHLSKLNDGSHGGLPEVSFLKSSHVEIRSDIGLYGHIDGEMLCGKTFSIAVEKEKLSFMVP
ncbi:MAG: YegS/Rv2252/BmrU family lipid kinase [Cyclobacteriaceae bacterium]|nr:YegS/Rv2252/BmrU family lipid kinase [Cyclobacteriaceae bacterium]